MWQRAPNKYIFEFHANPISTSHPFITLIHFLSFRLMKVNWACWPTTFFWLQKFSCCFLDANLSSGEYTFILKRQPIEKLKSEVTTAVSAIPWFASMLAQSGWKNIEEKLNKFQSGPSAKKIQPFFLRQGKKLQLLQASISCSLNQRETVIRKKTGRQNISRSWKNTYNSTKNK